MGLRDWFAPRKHAQQVDAPSRIELAVGAENDGDVSLTFNDKNITYSGDLTTYDYNSILRNKQDNIVKLYELSDYYVDADPIYRGIIKEVYTPFSIADGFRLVGANEKVKQKYIDYYKRINLRDKMESIFLQFYKYANVYIYLMEDGSIITLPVHLCRVANVMVDGEPVVEMNCRSIRDDLKKQASKAVKDYIEDEELDIRLLGFPPEVRDAVKAGANWVQLNPKNTFVLQDLKEDWARYAIPMIASCLRPFAKKELISNWENALLNLGARSFVHVTYGDPKHDVLPDINALRQVNSLFRQAMTGTALATTNCFCEAKVVQPKTDDLFEYDKYKAVNADILSAGGISGVIVSGRSEDGSTFASAQVSMQTAAMRIKQAKDNFCEMMNKINLRLNGANGYLPHSSDENVPKFTFPPVDLSGNKAFQESCMKLWKEGVVSNETMLQAYGYDIKQEMERLKTEKDKGVFDVFVPPAKRQGGEDEETDNGGTVKTEPVDDTITIGRPVLDDTERNSDPAKSVTGRQPKGSNPEGSEEQN